MSTHKRANDDSSDEDRFSQAPHNPKRSMASDLTISSAISRELSATDVVVVILAAASRQEVVSQSKTPRCNILV